MHLADASTVNLDRRHTAGRTILVLQALVILALVGGYLTKSFFFPIASDMVPYLSFQFILLASWLCWSWRETVGSFFNPYGIFLAAAIVFNGGQLFLEPFGLNEEGILTGAFTAVTLVDTIFLVSISICAFHFGALLSATKYLGTYKRGREDSTWEDLFALRLVGWGARDLGFPVLDSMGEGANYP